jgi:hypothetical protein
VGIFSKKDKPSEEPRQLVVNRLVQAAQVDWDAQQGWQTLFGVLRQCTSGELLLDGTESTFVDPSHPFQQGDSIAIGYTTDGQGRRLLVAFTDNERLAAYREHIDAAKPPIAFGQSAASVMQMAAKDYDGIAIDPGRGDHPCIAFVDDIHRGLTDDPGVNEALKSAIVAEQPLPAIVAAADAAPVLFIGVAHDLDAAGQPTGGISVPAVTGPDGRPFGVAFTTPAELWSWAPELEARPTGFANIAAVAVEDGQGGVVLDPAGPMAVLPVELLAESAARRE